MQSSIETLTNEREVYEDTAYTSWERLRMWWRRVLSALWDCPPKTYCKTIRIGPDDPRWNEGMLISYKWMNFADARGPWLGRREQRQKHRRWRDVHRRIPRRKK